MDDLTRAFSQFYPSSSGGGSSSGFGGQPPFPSPPVENSAVVAYLGNDSHHMAGGEDLGGGLNQITQDHLWEELHAQEEQREILKVNKGADRLQRDYQLFKERARNLVESRGILVRDPRDIDWVADAFLEEKTPQQVAYASKAILNAESRTAKHFVSELEIFTLL